METATRLSRPTVPEDKLVVYVKKSTPTSGANVVKALMLIEALEIPHHIEIVPSPKDDTWFHAINPQKMVPAMEDVELRDGKRLDVWESGACLMFLVDKFDKEGLWGGKDLWERTQVRNWLEMHSAGLGATAKLWLTLKTISINPEDHKDFKEVLEILTQGIKNQYTILNARLSAKGQRYVALPDRPTIADLANLPFANAQVAAMAGIEIDEWSRLKEWSEEISAMEPVKAAWNRVGDFGV